MDVVLHWLPMLLAASLRAQPPELLMLVGGLVMAGIMLAFYVSMRR